jgi:hypothetical protein
MRSERLAKMHMTPNVVLAMVNRAFPLYSHVCIAGSEARLPSLPDLSDDSLIKSQDKPTLFSKIRRASHVLLTYICPIWSQPTLVDWGSANGRHCKYKTRTVYRVIQQHSSTSPCHYWATPCLPVSHDHISCFLACRVSGPNASLQKTLCTVHLLQYYLESRPMLVVENEPCCSRI